MKSTDKLRQFDQHQLLISAAKELEVGWPRFFDWKPITGTRKVHAYDPVELTSSRFSVLHIPSGVLVHQRPIATTPRPIYES